MQTSVFSALDIIVLDTSFPDIIINLAHNGVFLARSSPKPGVSPCV